MQPDPPLADILEGQFRPGFFTGVCTVVMKLFARACSRRVAVFGQKDYQQLMVLRRMAQQFALPIDIVARRRRSAPPTAWRCRSRNGYLGEAERAEAMRAVARAAREAAAAARGRARQSPRWKRAPWPRWRARGWQPDYLAVRRRSDLQPPLAGDAAGSLVVLGAARLGNTRLIDNFEV